MKKILTIILFSISCLAILSFSIIFIIYASNKKVKEEYFTILESKSYVYEENRKMSFTIYSNKKNSLILYPDKNIYNLTIDTYDVELTDVEFDVNKYGNYYLYHMTANMPEVPLTIEDSNATLSIHNNKYTLKLNLGGLSIFDNNEYELLSYKDLYGVYSEIDGIKELVGINLELTNEYSYLTSLKLGGFSYGTLKYAIPNIKLPQDIDILEYLPNYKIDKVEEEYTLALTSTTYFIPISYIDLKYTKVSYIILILDGHKYYIDQHQFSLKILDYDIYKDYLIKGEFIYD